MGRIPRDILGMDRKIKELNRRPEVKYDGKSLRKLRGRRKAFTPSWIAKILAAVTGKLPSGTKVSKEKISESRQEQHRHQSR